MKNTCALILIVVFATFSFAREKRTSKYERLGNAQDAQTPTIFGVLLMGGGNDIDGAFQWMCALSGGGDFLVLRARGDDAYNPYIRDLCHPNSVATLVIPSRKAAMDGSVAEKIRNAEAIFISGGDQANYLNFWKDTPVQKAIQDQIKRGVPVGGTSAGLAVLGQFAFAALNDTAYSKVVLSDPYDKTVTVVRDYLKVPHMNGIITDTHFAKRDRLGRLLVFMARIIQDGWAPRVRAIAVDEGAAVSVDANGQAKVLGSGAAYFLQSTQPPAVCQKGIPLTFSNIAVHKIAAGGAFNLPTWSPLAGDESYELSVDRGTVRTTHASGSPY